MTIEIDTGIVDNQSDNTTYQFVPTSNPAGWNTFNAGAGLWQKWNNSDGDTTGNSLISLSDVITAHTGLNVVRTYLRLGMGNSYYNGGTGTTAWVDKATIGGVTYDFVVGAGSTPTSCTGASITPPDGTTACYSTIQAAIDAADPDETINVAAGTYNENLNIDRSITLKSTSGAANTTIAASGTVITINANGVVIDGLTVTNNSTSGMGIYASDYSNLDIKNNTITNIGNGENDVVGRGVVIVSSASPVDDINITNNHITNITSGLRTGSNSVSAAAIAVGWSTGTADITNLRIEQNTISDINANTSPWSSTKGQGAYGVLINHADHKSSGNMGSTIEAQIINNTISDLEGLWAHAIGLEGDTPNAIVTGNTISGIIDHKSGTDEAGVFFQDNLSGDTVTISGNKFNGGDFLGVAIHPDDVATYGYQVDATNNYWGNAEPDFTSITSGDINHEPWWMDSAMTLPSTLIAVFNGIHTTLEGLDIANNIDTCSTHPNACTNLYFEKSISGIKMGRITFTATLDLTNGTTQTFLQNLGTYMEANAGSMKFDASTQAEMKAAGAQIKMYGTDELGYTDDTASIIVKDDEGNILSIEDANYPELTDISYSSDDGGTLTFSTDHFTQFDLPGEDQTTPDAGGNATLSDDTPQVVVTDPDLALDLSIADGTDNPTIDVSAFITDGTGTIPKIDINSDDPDNADVHIPATTVTGPADWDGIIAAPTITTIDLPVVSGETLTTSVAIEIGFTDAELSFDNAVRILLPGQAGKRAGYSRPETDFTEITNTCVSVDNQTDIDADLVGVREECKIDSGLDLVIWTKHFTKFAAYTQTTNSTSSSSSSSTSSNPSAPVCNDQKPGSAPVLLSAVAGFNSVTLTWSKASDPVSYYLMTFGTSSGSQTYGNPNIGGKDTTSYTVSGLSGGTTYYFKIRAGNGCMPGDFSNELSAAPSGGFVEGVPAGFEAGVLGEATKSGELTGESIGEPTPTTAVINAGLVKGIESIAKNKSFKYIFPIILIILPIALIYYFYKKRNNSSS